MQRYEKLNRRIESFRLYMNGKINVGVDHYCYALAEEFIVKAMKMGATDFRFKILNYDDRCFVLPPEVLRSKTVTRLSLKWCRISAGEDGKVSCSKLKSLSLKDIHSEGDLIRDIISNCPLLEKIKLPEIKSWCLRSVVGGPMNVSRLCTLKSLLLADVDVETSFFSDFSSKFPCLKGLALHYCGGYYKSGIKICSHSLEFICFRQDRLLRADFDVPSIVRFEFRGVTCPLLSFKPTLREWESDVYIKCNQLSAKGFLKVNKLLTRLSSSKITLSLSIDSLLWKNVNFQHLPKPALENLIMESSCTVLLTKLTECVLRSCRPKFIVYDWFFYCSMLTSIKYRDFLEGLQKTFVPGRRGHCSMINGDMFDLHDLEEFSVQLYERESWMPRPWKTDADNHVEDFRFRLRPVPWKTLLDDAINHTDDIGFGLRWVSEPFTPS